MTLEEAIIENKRKQIVLIEKHAMQTPPYAYYVESPIITDQQALTLSLKHCIVLRILDHGIEQDCKDAIVYLIDADSGGVK